MATKLLRWLAITVGVLVLLVLIGAGFIYFRSEALLAQTHNAPETNVTVPTDAATVERGRYLAHTVSVCVDCHGETLEGTVFIDDPALGRVVAPNLTAGQNGVGSHLSDADIARVLRYGVLSDGRSAKVMPSADYQHLNDADLAAIIAYMRSAPPQASDLPTTVLRPLGRILLALGQLPILVANEIDPNTDRTPIPPGVTAEYGRYLADIAGCTGCHGPGLSGGPVPAAPPDWPPASNLTPSSALGQWSEADFIQTIRSGVNPAGAALDPVMPWPRYGAMTDDDLKALWAFISTVPPRADGNR